MREAASQRLLGRQLGRPTATTESWCRMGPRSAPPWNPTTDAARVVKRMFAMAEAGNGDAAHRQAPSTTRVSPVLWVRLWSKTRRTTSSSATRLYTGTLVWGARAKDSAEPVRIERGIPRHRLQEPSSAGSTSLMRSRAPRVVPSHGESQAPICSVGWSSASPATGRSAARTPRAASSPTTSASRS